VDFSSSRKGIDNSAGAAIWLRHRKGRLKILYLDEADDPNGQAEERNNTQPNGKSSDLPKPVKDN
jgi:hypothetical protein